MARWLVTGANGMLGRELTGLLIAAGQDVISLARAELDITDGDAVAAALAGHRPAVVANCAGWTAVDEAETREAEALRINGDGPRWLALGCERVGARLLQPSTDYVFGGDAGRPYPEDAKPDPRTAYGRTKLAGEQAVLEVLPESGYVIRTAWLYGAHGENFVRTMIRLEASLPSVDVVADQVGQPTWTRDLAERLVALGHGDAPAGVYHGTNSGRASWYGLAREVFTLLGADPDRVRPTTTAAFPRPAPRPAFSVLGHDRWSEAGLTPMRDWRAALAEAIPLLHPPNRSLRRFCLDKPTQTR